MDKKLRLDKYLADMGMGSRSQVKEAIRKGNVQVNKEMIKTPEFKVSSADQVTFSGQPVAYAGYEYYMLNKPAGTVSATDDRRYPTVVSLIETKLRSDLFPVGRLDLDTEGLLLITNDGALAHELLSPRKHVAKCYYAKVAGNLPKDCREQFAAGVLLEDGTVTLPAEVSILEEGAVNQVLLTIYEGKYHQVKRMFEAVGTQVTYLKRISMGSLRLDEKLQPGQYRELTSDELASLKADKKKQ